MTRWIDASPSQRFWQYTYPAARRLIENGDWDKCIAESDRQIADAQARLDAAIPGDIEHRRWERRLADRMRERDNAVAMRDQDLATIAEADRRNTARRQGAKIRMLTNAEIEDLLSLDTIDASVRCADILIDQGFWTARASREASAWLTRAEAILALVRALRREPMIEQGDDHMMLVISRLVHELRRLAEMAQLSGHIGNLTSPRMVAPLVPLPQAA